MLGMWPTKMKSLGHQRTVVLLGSDYGRMILFPLILVGINTRTRDGMMSSKLGPSQSKFLGGSLRQFSKFLPLVPWQAETLSMRLCTKADSAAETDPIAHVWQIGTNERATRRCLLIQGTIDSQQVWKQPCIAFQVFAQKETGLSQKRGKP